jgi:hypothetical protein
VVACACIIASEKKTNRTLRPALKRYAMRSLGDYPLKTACDYDLRSSISS